MLKKEELPECPVATTVALIGSKWKLLIIRNLQQRPWRFNELKKDLEGISQKVLTDSLRSMEEDGLVIRTVYPEVPPRVEYSLSDLGKSLKPLFDFMVEWGTYYKEICNIYLQSGLSQKRIWHFTFYSFTATQKPQQ
jgi:DNA-binding HxlR family transcriptional regulator